MCVFGDLYEFLTKPPAAAMACQEEEEDEMVALASQASTVGLHMCGKDCTQAD